MKAVILHGTDNDHTGNWFPWLKSELEKLGIETWVPDLPEAKRPNLDRWSEFLLSQDFDFSNSLIVGHSAGAVEILDLLQKLPDPIKLRAAIFVAVFKGDLGWDVLADLNHVKYDFKKIAQRADKKIVIHSNDDPHCPIDGAREIASKIDADFIEMDGMQHFSADLDPRFDKFPEILEIIKQKVL